MSTETQYLNEVITKLVINLYEAADDEATKKAVFSKSMMSLFGSPLKKREELLIKPDPKNSIVADIASLEKKKKEPQKEAE